MPRKDRLRKDFKCTHENCNAAFNRRDRLKMHLLVHDNERPFICSFDECLKSYTRVSHLKRHEATHETNFPCKVEGCETVLNSKQNLTKHMDVVHNKRKTFKCDICDASFNKNSWLKRHVYRHTGVRPYKCPYENCERRFLVPNKMRKHMLVHEGYTCGQPDCSRKFDTWSLYVKHFKVYHAVVHKCDICEKIFSTSPNLRSHKALHSNEREVFICPKPFCTRFYFAKKNLNHHIRTYHDKRPFVCTNNTCQKTFTTEALLSAHLSDHDPNKRLKKRKKKKAKAPKPSFAAFLAGFTETEACTTSKTLEENNEHSNLNVEVDTESSGTKGLNEDKCGDEILSESENSDEVQIEFIYKQVPENIEIDEFKSLQACDTDIIVRES